MSKKVKRLFLGFVPKRYIIELDPDRETMRLSGTVTIAGQKLGRPGQRLVFHQHGLRITKATITRRDKRGAHDIPVTRINHHSAYDEVRLHTEHMLYAGQYTVHMEF